MPLGIFIITLTTVLLCLLLTVFLHVFSPDTVLVIEDVKSGQILWQEDIQAGEWFYHEYLHSVEKSPVIEKFKVNRAGEILTMESWTKSFGAGLPYEQQGTVEMVDGFYVLKDLHRPIHGGAFLMQPSNKYPHTFHFRDHRIMLSEEPYASTRIKIEVRHLTWLEAILEH
nr:DUF1850 domain-containing protein [Caldalkalibacillus salinus]